MTVRLTKGILPRINPTKQHFPVGLIDMLPPAPRGYERLIVGGKIILVEIATQIIRDVLIEAVFD